MMEGRQTPGGVAIQSGVSLLFLNLLNDPHAVALFRDFLRDDKSLAFLLDVSAFKSSFSPTPSPILFTSTTPTIVSSELIRGHALNISLVYLHRASSLVFSSIFCLSFIDEAQIYTKYLVTQAPRLVEIPPHLKLAIDSLITRDPSLPLPPDLFDLAASDVGDKLQEDMFKRFIRTPQYEAYQLSKSTGRNDTGGGVGGVMLCKLPGEALVHKPVRVLYWNPLIKSFVQSGLYITNFRLTFGNFSNPAKATDLELLKPQIETIEIHCKDFRRTEFQIDGSPSASFPSPTTKGLKRTIKSLCFPRATTDLFAFSFKPTWSDRKDWQRYNIIEEFMRQGISFEHWRFTDINFDYSMCNSYASRLVVPTTISDEQLIPVFGYRSRGRIPVLCWSHPFTGASISRSSQPNSGVLRTRCPEDEALLKAIGETGGNTRTLYLLDARPRANALGNTVKGKGFENVGSYSNCKIEFLGIANIHAMRESLQKLETLCLSGNEDQWYSVVDSAKWFDHMRDIFVGTMRTVELVEEGYPVLLHCSDGWDRTAQLSSLSMLLLDSYYRTISGFIVLVEKEWVACGHRFLSRVGHGIKNPSDQNRSPVFLQFLDSVYQITLQFGCSFEFNENFLLAIAQHLYTCQYGTFLFDSDQERQQHQVPAKTTSIWSYIRTHQPEFENPFYMPDSNVLRLDVHMNKFTFWARLYLMWVRQSPSTTITPEMRGMMLKSMNEQMMKRVKGLEKEVQSLREAQQQKGVDAQQELPSSKEELPSTSLQAPSSTLQQTSPPPPPAPKEHPSPKEPPPKEHPLQEDPPQKEHPLQQDPRKEVQLNQATTK